MSSVILWWAGRLTDQYPVHERFNQVPYNVKPTEGAIFARWPGRVSREVLYDDYRAWVEDNNKLAWPGTDPDDPRWAKPASSLVFYSTMAPYLYVNGKDRMVKNYLVSKTISFEGSFRTIKVRRYFVRLGTLGEHVEAYTRETGKAPSSAGSLTLP